MIIKKLIKIRFKFQYKKIEVYKIYKGGCVYRSKWIKGAKKILKIFEDLFLII